MVKIIDLVPALCVHLSSGASRIGSFRAQLSIQPRLRDFMSNALRWLPQLRAGDLIRAPFANVRIAAIDPADIAAVAAVALTSDSHSSHAYELSGPEALLPAEQVSSLARVLGRNLRFEALPDSAAGKELSKTFSPDFMEAVLRFFTKGESLTHESSLLSLRSQADNQAPLNYG